MTRPQTLQELSNDLTARVDEQKKLGSEYFFIETWELDSILRGEFLKPDDVDTTEKDLPAFDDTGDLSDVQIEMILMRDRGQIP